MTPARGGHADRRRVEREADLEADLQHCRERLLATHEEERRRLRLDLHDSLGPTLTGMALTLDAARNLIDSDPEAANRVIGELRGETQQAIVEIRRIAGELRPSPLADLGLVPAVRAHAERLSAGRDRLRVSLDAPDRFPDLPATVEVAGYRIVLEALSHAVRHAQAHDCRVGLALEGDELRIEVADDGVEVRGKHRTELASMRERTVGLGGRMEVAPREDGGTQVVARLPVGGVDG